MEQQVPVARKISIDL